MTSLRIESVADPLSHPPDRLDTVLRLVALGQAAGALGPDAGALRVVDLDAVRRLTAALARNGVAREPAARLAAGDPDLDAVLRLALRALQDSPLPAGEWGPAREVLGDDLLARVLGISPASLRRYAAGARPTPDTVAGRLHGVARIVAALSGSYNEYGIRRWFTRPRRALGGMTPAEALAADGGEGRGARAVALAEDLLGAGSAT